MPKVQYCPSFSAHNMEVNVYTVCVHNVDLYYFLLPRILDLTISHLKRGYWIWST